MLGDVRTTLITLHGFTMNARGLGHMMAELEPRLQTSVDVVHVNAPHVASEASVAGMASAMGGFRSKPPNLEWWNASEDGLDYHGWSETRAHVAAEVARHGPVGLLGFSQGAAVSAALAAASRAGQFPELRFVVLVAGFTPRARDIAPLFAHPVAVPSLHVWGDADRFAKHSPALVERFEPATREVQTWPGRHEVPDSGAAAEAIVDFIRRHAIGPRATAEG
jgi:predicted esterase